MDVTGFLLEKDGRSYYGYSRSKDSAATMPQVVQRFKDLAADPKTTTRREFADFIKTDIAKWRKVAQEANIHLE